MLPMFDPDLVGWLMERFDELRIEVRTRSTVQKVEKTGDSFVVHTLTGDRLQTVAADLVVHAAGRVPDLDALDLESGAVRQGLTAADLKASIFAYPTGASDIAYMV